MKITDLEMTQATIETFGGFVCLMLSVIIILNGHKKNSWKFLTGMFLSTSGIFFAETFAYIFRGNTDKLSIAMTRISNFTVFFLNIVLIMLYVNYVYSLLQEKGDLLGQTYKKIVGICVIINMAILIINLFTKWMYTFDESNYYHRNNGWYVYTIINLVCILTFVVMVIRHRKAMRKTMLAAILFYILVPVIAILIQAFIYGISITNIGIFIALLLMLLAYLKEWSGTKEIEEKKRRSLEIFILFTIMTFSMSASIISCIVSIGRISSENSESNSMIISHMINDGIKNEFLKPIMVAETMSNDYFLKSYMRKSGEESDKAVEKKVATYLDSIRTGFGYQMVFSVSDASKAYYTYDGIDKHIDVENDKHDIWYKMFLKEGKHYELNVDTDEANNRKLSVFVNTEICDDDGSFLGVCGVGVEMKNLQKLLKNYEKNYNVKVDLVDKTGLIQVDSDDERIEKDYIDNSYFKNVSSDDFFYEEGSDSSRMTRYMDDLGWYLVVEDCVPNKIDVVGVVTPSVIIFVLGLVMMGIVFFVISLRERKIAKELIKRRRISITDDMTGLFNRYAYEEACKKILKDELVSQMTVIMMDVNGLKTVNDTYGHMAGDELIIGAAKCIQSTIGKYGKVYRTGGDEFVALIKCTESQMKDTLETLEHITRKWSGEYQSELSISKGIVVCGDYKEMTFDDMKKLADKFMYEDKNEYYERTGKVRRKS